MARTWLAVSAIYGFLAVLLGAFGAHGLKTRVSPEMLANWQTATSYHFYHALALLAVALLMRQAPSRALSVAAVCFTVGVLIFSGSLYALTLSGVRMLGAVTPFGGLLFMVGWVALLIAALRNPA